MMYPTPRVARHVRDEMLNKLLIGVTIASGGVLPKHPLRKQEDDEVQGRSERQENTDVREKQG
jgi:hypothetical protein